MGLVKVKESKYDTEIKLANAVFNLCYEFHWTVEHVLEMPIPRFIAFYDMFVSQKKREEREMKRSNRGR